jgi:tRNA pseudouridine38-40 synthase
LRYRFLCEYLGSAFEGWQEQRAHGALRGRTVQSELERAFGVALRIPVRIVGAGRTDSGVHARGQCAHFDLDAALDSAALAKLERSVNGIACPEVRVRNLEPCADDFHARYSAFSRSYSYTLYLRPVSIAREYGWDASKAKLNLKVMEAEARSFLGVHDFSGFSIPRNDGKSTDCELLEFRLERTDFAARWHICGNRFLHRQVRSMVGLLYDVGRGYHKPGSVDAVFAGTFQGERTWAPPQGLVLESVGY